MPMTMEDSRVPTRRCPNLPLRCGFLRDLQPFIDQARDSIHIRRGIDGDGADSWSAPAGLCMREELTDDFSLANG